MKKRIVFLMCCVLAQSLPAIGIAYSQEISPQTAVVDVLRIEALLAPDFEEKSINGKLEVRFTMLQEAQEVALDAQKMTVVDRTPQFEIISTDTQIIFKGYFKANTTYTAIFDYQASPKQTLYFVNNQGSEQLWTQGQGKYTSHWLPSLDDMNDKIEFDISFRDVADKAYITNGSFTYQEKDYGVVDYNFDMKQPISSYLVALVSGDYTLKKQIATSGVPLEYYYYPKDSLKVASTYRHSKEIFEFLEQEIGVPYPWQVYKQVPVKDFLYAGMENASCTIFSDDFMVDAIGFNDRNYVNVNAHELAHQWFGDLVTETKSDHHWLHEGFATYYALLAEREIFGEDYFYYKLFESAEQLRALSDQGKGQKLVAAGGSSLTYYQKGAWAVHILRELVGEDAFAKAVKAYLTKHAYQNVTTADFMTEVAAVTQVDLDPFKKNWLYQSAFQAQDALESLKKSAFMRSYFELQAKRVIPIPSKLAALMEALDTGNEYLGQEAVYQLAGEPITSVLPAYKKALATNNVFVRQAIATSIEQLPQELVLDFYDLLEDASYITREQTFIKLWVYHQQQGDIKEQQELLEKMSNQFGFTDGNIRTLWLTLSLATPDYKPQESLSRYQELLGYTDPSEPFKLRQNAFQYLLQLNSFEEVSLRNLLEACVHHTWRFRESARGMLNQVLKDSKKKSLLTQLISSLPQKQQDYLAKLDVE